MMFSVANLGDAALNIASATVNAGATIEQSGLLFVANGTSAPMTLTLADELLPFLVIKDTAGNAGQFPITIASPSDIDGAASVSLSIPFQWIWLSWNGSSYSVIG